MQVMSHRGLGYQPLNALQVVPWDDLWSPNGRQVCLQSHHLQGRQAHQRGRQEKIKTRAPLSHLDQRT